MPARGSPPTDARRVIHFRNEQRSLPLGFEADLPARRTGVAASSHWSEPRRIPSRKSLNRFASISVIFKSSSGWSARP